MSKHWTSADTTKVENLFGIMAARQMVKAAWDLYEVTQAHTTLKRPSRTPVWGPNKKGRTVRQRTYKTQVDSARTPDWAIFQRHPLGLNEPGQRQNPMLHGDSGQWIEGLQVVFYDSPTGHHAEVGYQHGDPLAYALEFGSSMNRAFHFMSQSFHLAAARMEQHLGPLASRRGRYGEFEF